MLRTWRALQEIRQWPRKPCPSTVLLWRVAHGMRCSCRIRWMKRNDNPHDTISNWRHLHLLEQRKTSPWKQSFPLLANLGCPKAGERVRWDLSLQLGNKETTFGNAFVWTCQSWTAFYLQYQRRECIVSRTSRTENGKYNHRRTTRSQSSTYNIHGALVFIMLTTFPRKWQSAQHPTIQEKP